MTTKTTKTTPTRGQEVAADVSALLRARNPLLWVVTREEARVEALLVEAAAAAAYVARTWDIAQGARQIDGSLFVADREDPGAMLALIRDRAEGKATGGPIDRCAWIMRDLPVWVSGNGGAVSCRALRNLARFLPGVKRDNAQAVIVLSPSNEVPPELANHATVIDWPLPDRKEIASLLDAAIERLPEDMREGAAPNGARDAAVDAAVGLSGEEAQACYARSLVTSRKIDAALVAKEKKRVIASQGGLEWYDPLPGGLDAVGGLDVLKAWLRKRANAYSASARAYGVVAPKGCMLVGIPGCGKSLTAKAISTSWNVPLIKVDLNALKSKFVGDSEQNIRRAFKLIEALGRCVVWLDEIEKAISGAVNGGSDGGVSTDALGAILTWMQERTSEAFVIATANQIKDLPPELLRKGRFDEVFFVNLPNAAEREAILAAALKSHQRPLDGVDLAAVSAVTADWTGSEIAALVPEAMLAGFEDGARPITTADLVAASRDVTPLSRTMADKIKDLRDWAKGNARAATSETAEVAKVRDDGRNIDF